MKNLPENLEDFIEEGLQVISKCPLCGHHYKPFTARIVEEREDSHLLHIQCSRCKGNMVALVYHGQLGLTSVGLITDLSADEVIKFKGSQPITVDEVIDFHHKLETQSKEFINFFI